MIAGGKTASLKALGLMTLMAKAGLFLPVAAGSHQPQLLWFDKVLADVGDGQNLQQSLSTFSGHVRRLRGVLATCTRQSLVLLDEVCPSPQPESVYCMPPAFMLAALLLMEFCGRPASITCSIKPG